MTTINIEKRRFLGAATTFVGAVGVISASVPFVLSWQPSARAKMAAGPVEAGIRNLEPGRMITVKWRGKPVWILRRTERNLKSLEQSRHLENLRDPDSLVDNQPVYAKNQFRSLREDIFVAVGICTHLGCVPTYLSSEMSTGDAAIYFCPCHGSKFDLAGRVFKNVPAPTNLIIPPYQFIDDDTIKIGSDSSSG